MNDQTNNPQDPTAPLPRSLMLALAQNMHAMKDYAKLSDAAKAQLIDQASRIHSPKEMQALVRDLGQFMH